MTFSIQIYYTSFYSTIIIKADYHFGKSTLLNYNRPIGYENGKSCFFENGTIRHCYFTEEDAPCVSIGGTCQDDSLSCSGGYESGLCGGGVNRRCCKRKFLLKHKIPQNHFNLFCFSHHNTVTFWWYIADLAKENTFFVLFVCLFVWDCKSHSKIVHLYEDVKIIAERLQILTYTSDS